MMMTDSHAPTRHGWSAPLNHGTGGYLFASGVLSINEPCDVGKRKTAESGESPPNTTDDVKTSGSLKFPSSSFPSASPSGENGHSGSSSSPVSLRTTVENTSYSSNGTAPRTPLDPKAANTAPPRTQKAAPGRTHRRSFHDSSKKPVAHSKDAPQDAFSRLHNDAAKRRQASDEEYPVTFRRSNSMTQGHSHTWQRLNLSDTQPSLRTHDTPPSLGPPSNGGTAPIPLLKQLAKGSERSSQASSTHSGGKVAPSSTSSAGSRRSKDTADKKAKSGAVTARAAAQQNTQWKRMTKGLSATKLSNEDKERDAQPHDTSKLLSMSAPTPRGEARRRGASLYSPRPSTARAPQSVSTPRKSAAAHASTRSVSGGAVAPVVAQGSRTHRPPTVHPSLEKILSMGPEACSKREDIPIAADRVVVAAPETVRGPSAAERYMSVRSGRAPDTPDPTNSASLRDLISKSAPDKKEARSTVPPPKLGKATSRDDDRDRAADAGDLAKEAAPKPAARDGGSGEAPRPAKVASVSLTALSKGEAKSAPPAERTLEPPVHVQNSVSSPDSKVSESRSPTLSSEPAPHHPALAPGKSVSLVIPPSRNSGGERPMESRHHKSFSMDSANGDFSISSMGADTPRDPLHNMAAAKCIDCGHALPSELPFCAATGKPHPTRPSVGERCVAPASHEDTDQPTAIDRGSIADTDTSMRPSSSYSLALKCTKTQAHYNSKSTRALLQCTGLSDIDENETVCGD